MNQTTPETTMTEENRFPNDDPNLYVFYTTKNAGCKESCFNPDLPTTKRDFAARMTSYLVRQGLLMVVSPDQLILDLQKGEESVYLPLLGYNYSEALKIVFEKESSIFMYTVHPQCEWRVRCGAEIRNDNDKAFEFIRMVLQLRGGDARYELPESAAPPLPPPISPRQS